MRAVIVATGPEPGQSETHGDNAAFRPSPMLPVGDRPILQHVVEWLVTRGFREFDMILAEHANAIESLLGDGQRWGCAIRYHLTAGWDRAASLVPALARNNAPFLLAQGDLLPQVEWDFETPRIVTAVNPAGSSLAIDSSGWTGWAWFPGTEDSQLPARPQWSEIRSSLYEKQERGQACALQPLATLSARNAGDYLESQRIAMTAMESSLQFSASPVSRGVWIGRNVSLPPSVELIPPVLIGADTQIQKMARIGPDVVIGSGCLIDESSSISRSAILAGSYVGRHLDVKDSVIDHSRLWNVKLGAAIDIRDAFLLGRVSSRTEHGLTAGKITAALFAALFLPLLFLVAALRLLSWRWPLFHSQCFVRTPAREGGTWSIRTMRSFLPVERARTADGWRHFFLVFLPALLCVLTGDLALTGGTPRSRDEWLELPRDWRELCLEGRSGILAESFVQTGPSAGEDERFASEAFCAVSGSARHSFRLIAKYLALLFLGRPGAVAAGSVRGL